MYMQHQKIKKKHKEISNNIKLFWLLAESFLRFAGCLENAWLELLVNCMRVLTIPVL